MLLTVWDLISYSTVYMQYKGICIKTPDFKTAILSFNFTKNPSGLISIKCFSAIYLSDFFFFQFPHFKSLDSWLTTWQTQDPQSKMITLAAWPLFPDRLEPLTGHILM